MEDSVDTTQHRITCWINEEGRNEVDLEFKCLGELLDSLFSMTADILGTHVPVSPGPCPILLQMTFARTCTGLRRM